MIRVCILIGFFIFSASANAALFGASTYEECVSDGKSGRTNFEMQALSRKCRNDFPMLEKLSKKKDVILFCRDVDEKAVYHIEVIGSKVRLSELPKRVLLKTSHDKNKITFKGEGKDKDTDEIVTIYGNILTSFGNGNIKVEYKDTAKKDIVYEFSCYEN